MNATGFQALCFLLTDRGRRGNDGCPCFEGFDRREAAHPPGLSVGSGVQTLALEYLLHGKNDSFLKTYLLYTSNGQTDRSY